MGISNCRLTGEEVCRNCHINKRCRITLETDVENDYFNRPVDTGVRELFIISENSRIPVSGSSLNLWDGIATLNIHLPHNCQVGDELRFLLVVTDPTQITPFENYFTLKVMEVGESGPGGSPKPSPSDQPGKDRETASGIALPPIHDVYENEWEQKDPPFDQYTALRIRYVGDVDGRSDQDQETQDIYDFFINMDNAFLKSELKMTSEEIELMKARFRYGMVLLGLALLHDDAILKKAKTFDQNGSNDEEMMERDIEKEVENFSRAVAPILLPMIESLGGLDLADQ